MPPRFKKFKLCPGEHSRTTNTTTEVYMFNCLAKNAVVPVFTMSYKDNNVIRRRTENPFWRRSWKRSWPWCRWQTWPPFLALQPSLPLEIGKSENSPEFQKKIMKMKARRLTCPWCMICKTTNYEKVTYCRLFFSLCFSNKSIPLDLQNNFFVMLLVSFSFWQKK